MNLIKSISKVVGNKRTNSKKHYTHEIDQNIMRQADLVFTKNIVNHSDEIAFKHAIRKLAEEYPELNQRYDKHSESF